MMSTKRSFSLAALAVAALALSSCSSNEAAPIAGTSAIAPTSTTAAPTNTDETPTSTESVTTAQSQEASLTVTDIRIGRHETFDRVVYELAGTGTPGYRVGYVEQANQQGSGNPVEVAGAGIIEVHVLGVGMPFDTGIEPFNGPIAVPDGPREAVVSVTNTLIFEGQGQSFIGTTEPDLPFSVKVLTNPARVVVDIAH